MLIALERHFFVVVTDILFGNWNVCFFKLAANVAILGTSFGFNEQPKSNASYIVVYVLHEK